MKSLECVVKSEGDLKVYCVGETIVGFVELVGMPGQKYMISKSTLR